MNRYSLIYADPAWSYGNQISNGAAVDHYPTMSLLDMKRLPVWELAADNAVLAMWYTGTHNQEAIELAEAWGFKVRTMKGFTWVKLNQLAEPRINKALAEGDVTDFYDFLDLLNAETRMNGGNHTRANTEDVLIATRGAGLERKHAGIKQVVYSPLGAHSEKPWEVRHRLELLYGDVPRIELFSRSAAPGWSHWGNQCATASVELIPGCAINVVKTEAARHQPTKTPSALPAVVVPRKSNRLCAKSQSLTGMQRLSPSSRNTTSKLHLWELASWSSSSKLAALTGGLEPNNEYEN